MATDTATPAAAEEIHDAEVVETTGPAPSTALAVAPTPSVAVAPQVEAAELVQRLAVIKDAMDNAMTPDVDYGVIPGTSGKPSLLKPGAEKLGVLFQLDVEITNTKHWGPGDHLTVESQATVYHMPTGARMGTGEGMCTTREKKYGKRKQERKCPSCGAEAVIKGKAEFGGGWLCWKKKDGCGAKFTENAAEIVSQEAGEIDNPDLADTWNTVIKMAAKRARVDAILNVTGASALFTQDVEDNAQPADASAMGNLQPFGPAADAARIEQAQRALAALLEDHPDVGIVHKVLEKVAQRAGGYLPEIAALSIGITAGAWKAAQPGQPATSTAPQSTPPQTGAGQQTMSQQLGGPNQPPAADAPPSDVPAPGSLAGAPTAIKANTCTCECGFDQAEAEGVDPHLLDHNCPVHGVPIGN